MLTVAPSPAQEDEKRLADECRLLGPLLGGQGKRGEKSRLTLAKIVRGIASGDVRRYCEERERKLQVIPQGPGSLGPMLTHVPGGAHGHRRCSSDALHTWAWSRKSPRCSARNSCVTGVSVPGQALQRQMEVWEGGQRSGRQSRTSGHSDTAMPAVPA